MNAYFIHAGVWWGYEGMGDLVCDVVIAQTRGKAKSIFYKEYSHYIDSYTDIKLCRLVEKNVDLEEGCIGNKRGIKYDRLWEKVPGKWGNINI